ncbi:MAG TPA: hypothetical protein VNL71_02190 [Chloroflexota bacterium]|nr:hypothetical protein [Chloroflexota bacterium]
MDLTGLDLDHPATEQFHGTIAAYTFDHRAIEVVLIQEPGLYPYCEVWADRVDHLTGDERISGTLPTEDEVGNLAAAFPAARWDNDEAMAHRSGIPIRRLFPGMADHFETAESPVDYWTLRVLPADAAWPSRFATEDSADDYTHAAFVPALAAAVGQLPALLRLAYAAARNHGSESERAAHARAIMAAIPMAHLRAGAAPPDDEEDQGPE